MLGKHHRVTDEIEIDLPHATFITNHLTWEGPVPTATRRLMLCDRAYAHEVDHVGQQAVQCDVLHRERNLTRLALRDTQNVTHDHQQAARRCAWRLGTSQAHRLRQTFAGA